MVSSFKGEYDPDLERIHNLFCFNVNFSKFVYNEELWKQSPDYILEKWNHWIGFQPDNSDLSYPESLDDFMDKYLKIWKNIDGVKNILIYLKLTEQRLDLMTMVFFFEKYLGPISMISPISTKGLHPNLYEFVETVIGRNDDNITKVLRDMKLGQLI
jgi:hypothetical protein